MAVSNTTQKKIAVGILGATGLVGQRLSRLLNQHPWFIVREVIASQRSVGKLYGNCVDYETARELSEQIKQLRLKQASDPLESKILFSALDPSIAGEIEETYAKQDHIIISNASSHRLCRHVPLIVPEVNGEHLALLKDREQKTGKGIIITNPNCVATILVLALHPIFKQFGLEEVMVHTMQAISGAGYPGIAALDILGNIIPHISGEEEKIATETVKVLGKYRRGEICPSELKISAICNRVPIREGHILNISFTTTKTTNATDLVTCWQQFTGPALPSTPRPIIYYYPTVDRPQPRWDTGLANGMAIAIGNLRRCGVLHWKCTVLGHNLIRGAAGAALLNAEYLVASGHYGD